MWVPEFPQLRKELIVSTRLVLLVLLLNLPALALIRNVPAEYNTVQDGILACSNGDTLLVADGRYVENLDYRGRNIVVASHFLLDGDVNHILETILDGSQPANTDTGSVVRIISGEDSTTALIGFTITGGTGTKFRDQDDNLFYVEGGGIIIENSYPLIAHNLIVDNEATRTVPGAQSSGGGGIRYGYCAPRIHNNVILRNAGKYGGGVVGFFADGDIRNNVVAENSGGNAYGGGGLWFGGAGHTNTVINNTIVGNESVQSGGGIRLFAGVLNGHGNIVWGNNANSGSDQVGGSAGNIHLDYSCVEGGLNGTGNIDSYPQFSAQNLYIDPTSPCINTGNPDAEWNDTDNSRNDIGCYGGPTASEYPDFGGPKIRLPAEFFNFMGFPREGDVIAYNRGTSLLHIDSISFVERQWFSLINYPEVIGPVTNMAISLLSMNGGDVPVRDTMLVYHNDANSENPMRIVILDEGTPADDIPLLPSEFSLHPAYPNPFNPSTTISFALPTEQFVSIKITDIQGRQVAELLNSKLSAGEHSVQWNASSFASGTYFAVLHSGKWQAQTKLTLLK